MRAGRHRAPTASEEAVTPVISRITRVSAHLCALLAIAGVRASAGAHAQVAVIEFYDAGLDH